MSSIPDTQTQAALASNKIAIAAVAISIAAFLVAYLQLLLGNLMSGNALWKTNQAAIGVTARHRSWRLGLRRIKVLYPRIDLRIMSILDAAHASAETRIERSFLDKLVKKHGYEWRELAVHEDIASEHVGDRYSCLFDQKTKRHVTKNMLPFLDRVRLWWWLQNNLVYSADRPRATWASILQIYRITDASTLIHSSLDADTIPSGIDVPVQRVRMSDLGQLALTLGCTHVQIDISTRHFRAEGPHCTITTENIPAFGIAAKFEGDMRNISQIGIWKCNHQSVALAMAMTLGQFSIGEHCTQGFIDLRLLHQTLNKDWNPEIPSQTGEQKAIPNNFRYQIIPGYCAQEAKRLRLCFRAVEACVFNYNRHGLRKPIARAFDHRTYETISSALEQLIHMRNLPEASIDLGSKEDSSSAKELRAFTVWQHNTQLIVPTVFPVAIITAIPYIFCGFPSGVFLSELLPWLRLEAQNILEGDGLFEPNVIFSASSVQELAFLGNISFLNSDSLIRMGRTTPSKGERIKCSWLSSQWYIEYSELPKDLREVFGIPTPSTPRIKNVKAPILPEMFDLLEHFEPQVWAEDIREQLRDIDRKLYPSNMLWCQVVLLDIAIRLLIKQGTDQVGDIEPNKAISGIINEGKEVLKAITESYRPFSPDNLHGDGSAPPNISGSGSVPPCNSECHAPLDDRTHQFQTWDLHKALVDHCSFFKDLNSEEANKEYGRLAVMFKLRALFFIAFLMVGPDSSQVYEARASQAHIPII